MLGFITLIVIIGIIAFHFAPLIFVVWAGSRGGDSYAQDDEEYAEYARNAIILDNLDSSASDDDTDILDLEYIGVCD